MFQDVETYFTMIDEPPDVRQESTSEAADRVGELSKTAILGDGLDKNPQKKSGKSLSLIDLYEYHYSVVFKKSCMQLQYRQKIPSKSSCLRLNELL